MLALVLLLVEVVGGLEEEVEGGTWGTWGTSEDPFGVE